ncbi:MAG: radical SAM protein [Kosmotoga sp.]|nr:MAG: radical SAM protein [Kosmotoga sp.]
MGIEKFLDKSKDVFEGISPNFLKAFGPWIMKHPRHLFRYKKLLNAYKEAENKRSEYLNKGVMVPPVLILSITSRCNLKCSGCLAYAAGTVKDKGTNLKISEWKSVIEEANNLGVYCYFIAGGEPFMFEGLLDICNAYKDRFFLIMTNGTAIKENQFNKLRRLNNVLVTISVEGDKKITDNRRGKDVYEKIIYSMKKLKEIGVLFGISVTIKRSNYEYWIKSTALEEYLKMGVKLAFFFEHIPVDFDGKESERVLTKEERKEFREWINVFRKENPLLMIHSPGDEEKFGGCVSAGRGFAHITPDGNLTPCPVTSASTHNVMKSSLEESFSAPFFKKIRENEHLLETEDSPCALFSHPEALRKIRNECLNNKES